MSNKQCSQTDRAITLILAGTHTRYAAARECGLSLSTVYRAWKRTCRMGGSIMTKSQFLILAADSLLFAQGRARAMRIPEAVIELWTFNFRSTK